MTKRRTRIQPVELFHTPKRWDELEAWIKTHNPEERPHLYTAAMMAWNLACHFTNAEPKRTLKKELKK